MFIFCLCGLALNMVLLNYLEPIEVFSMVKTVFDSVTRGTKASDLDSLVMEGPLASVFPGKAHCKMELSSRLTKTKEW